MSQLPRSITELRIKHNFDAYLLRVRLRLRSQLANQPALRKVGSLIAIDLGIGMVFVAQIVEIKENIMSAYILAASPLCGFKKLGMIYLRSRWITKVAEY